jgi:ribosomal protein S14
MYKGAQIAKCQRTGHPVSVRSDLSVSFLVPLCQLDFRVYASDGSVLWRRSFLRVEGGLALPWGNGGRPDLRDFPLLSSRKSRSFRLSLFYPHAVSGWTAPLSGDTPSSVNWGHFSVFSFLFY